MEFKIISGYLHCSIFCLVFIFIHCWNVATFFALIYYNFSFTTTGLLSLVVDVEGIQFLV